MSFENWHCAAFLWDVVPKTPRTVEGFGWRNFAVRSRLHLEHGVRPIIRSSYLSPLKDADLVSGRIATMTYDGASWLLSDVVTMLAPLNRYYNRSGTSEVTNVDLTPASSGAMHYGLAGKEITYNLPPAADFGIGYIGFMNNYSAGVTINAAIGTVSTDEFQFMNNFNLKTISLTDFKAWIVLLCDGENWLVFSAAPSINAKLWQSLSNTGYKKHDGGLIEQWEHLSFRQVHPVMARSFFQGYSRTKFTRSLPYQLWAIVA
ncbi:hypothetical protein F9K77_14380 [Ochrobactrum sp. LMG 5442]|nr:hypothetical protein F9K77_14380 [Ochrobactrum sp. LMG 5442]